MTPAHCPHCGYSLTALQPFSRGKLTVDNGGGRIFWAERPVPLTASQRLLVTAIARSRNPLSRNALAEIIGAEETVDPPNAVDVQIHRAKAKFRELDPAFDCIRNVRQCGLEWRDND